MTSTSLLKITGPWFHGTMHHFNTWGNPPLEPHSKALIPHSFISLSSNLGYAELHKGPHGKICTAMLSPAAKTLDLRIKSPDSLLLYNKIRSTRLGSKYYGLASYTNWHNACVEGSILRFIFSSRNDHPKLFAQQDIIRHSINNKAVSEAVIYTHNFTREWIETVISPAKKMGYDAVICNELEKSLSPIASTQLFVFNAEYLSAPNWEVSIEPNLLKNSNELLL
ncbi:hypothetical protein [Methylophaga sp.]|uniref:hypothetical protein n=1 Tax=Methylophaga sp. TaxID=2024840 RepID=UPI00271E05EE|nr:hypothetical protein [Methylophaga sp.]MDO8827250.1 hypothetical protein [Methylophaga sp.]